MDPSSSDPRSKIQDPRWVPPKLIWSAKVVKFELNFSLLRLPPKIFWTSSSVDLPALDSLWTVGDTVAKVWVQSEKSCQKSLILSQKSPRWLWECIVRISSGPKKTLVLRMVEHRIEYMHLTSEYSRCLLEKYGLTRWSTMFFYPLISKGPCCICGVHMIQVIDAHISVLGRGKNNSSKANLQYHLGYSAIRFWHWVIPRQNYQIYLL